MRERNRGVRQWRWKRPGERAKGRASWALHLSPPSGLEARVPYRAGPGSSGKQPLAMRAAIRGPTSACCTPWLLHVVCLAVKGETFLSSLGPAGRLREPRMLPPWISLSRAKLATSGESSHGRHVALPQAMRAGVEGSRADRPNLATGKPQGQP